MNTKLSKKAIAAYWLAVIVTWVICSMLVYIEYKKVN